MICVENLLNCTADHQYDPSTHGCCGEIVAQQPTGVSIENQECCGDSIMDITQQMCCEGVINPNLDDTYRCCANKSFISTSQMCCSSVVNEKPSTDQKCCGETSYNRITQFCCGGSVGAKEVRIAPLQTTNTAPFCTDRMHLLLNPTPYFRLTLKWAVAMVQP